MLKAFNKSTRKSYSMINNPYFQKAPLEKVMSTNTWPVPYYKRFFKAYPVREQKSFKMDHVGHISDMNHLSAKNGMRLYNSYNTELGKVEKTMQRDSYVFEYDDISNQGHAYVYELSSFIDVGQKENKRILGKTNLI